MCKVSMLFSLQSVVWSSWSQKYALLLLLSVTPLAFCISHLFCHAISWLRHEVVLSPCWEVCCREEPVHSWHLLKQNQVIYTPSHTYLLCYWHLLKQKHLLYTQSHLLTMPSAFVHYWHLPKQKQLFYTPNHIYLLCHQHLYTPGICWNKNDCLHSQTHLFTEPTGMAVCALLASAETKQVFYTPNLAESLFDASNTNPSAFVHSWHLLKQKSKCIFYTSTCGHYPISIDSNGLSYFQMILTQFCKCADTSFPWQMQHWLSSCEDGPGLWVHLPEQRRGQWSQHERCPHHWWQRLHTPPSQPGPRHQGNESHLRSAGQKYCHNCVPCEGKKCSRNYSFPT